MEIPIVSGSSDNVEARTLQSSAQVFGIPHGPRKTRDLSCSLPDKCINGKPARGSEENVLPPEVSSPFPSNLLVPREVIEGSKSVKRDIIKKTDKPAPGRERTTGC